jgi:hypothetical protein
VNAQDVIATIDAVKKAVTLRRSGAIFCAECDLPIRLATPEDDLEPGAYVHASDDDSDNCDADGGHDATPRTPKEGSVPQLDFVNNRGE